MKRRNKNSKLKHQTFDYAIASHIDNLVSLSYFDSKQRQFRFFPDKIPQRNPDQVPNKLWIELVKQYLFRINEN